MSRWRQLALELGIIGPYFCAMHRIREAAVLCR